MPIQVTQNIAQVILHRTIPGVTMWNRLEGRPRTDNFERALRAEVRDALWMLTRQWQMGEFEGDDAGSPITAKVRVDTERLRSYRPGSGADEAFDDGTPLEARVEQMPVPMQVGGCDLALDIRLLAGRYWLKLVDTLNPLARPEYIARYPVHVPDPVAVADAPIVAHPQAWSAFAAAGAAHKAMDGVRFIDHLAAGGQAADGIPSLAGSETQAAALAARFTAWFGRLIAQPQQQAAWEADRLEYQFRCASAGKALAAEEYYQGHLDWYNLDVERAAEPPPAPTPPAPEPADDPGTGHSVLSMVPTQVRFNGMPNTRWWEFEDSRTSFGDIRPDTTDLGKLLLIEFGLVYANDWSLIPFTAPAGSIATVRGLATTNVFGERTWIEAAGRGLDDDWQRWAMFLESIKGQGRQPADTSLVLLPVAQQVLSGPPQEEFMLARDEMANMVWAVEQTIPLPSGDTRQGATAGYETAAFFLADYERRMGHPPVPPPAAADAKIRYRLMSEVPEHWIPLVPVHVEGDNREVQLQRAAMLRIFDGDTADPQPIRPRTSLLRAGLDGPDAPRKYVIHEEEVPRAGTSVTLGFKRTRWHDGRAWVWLGVRKQTGRGEGSSGLAFDRIVDVPNAL